MIKPSHFFLVHIIAVCAILIAQVTFFLEDANAFQSEKETKPALNTATLSFEPRTEKLTSTVYDDEKGVITFKVVINGREVWALLDTGTTGTLVDTGLALELGLETVDLEEIVQAATGKLKRKKALGTELSVPGQFEATADFNATDLSGVSRALQKDIGILIGRDILNSIAFYLDTRKNRVLFIPSGALKYKKETAISINLDKGLFKGKINGNDANIGVDLGARGFLNISKEVWKNYIDKDTETFTTKTIDATGNSYNSIYVKNAELMIGKISGKIAAKRSIIPTKGIDAYIGYQFFKGQLVLFDYMADEIVIFVQKDTE